MKLVIFIIYNILANNITTEEKNITPKSYRNKFFHNINLDFSDNDTKKFSFILEPEYKNCKINLSYYYKKFEKINFNFKLNILNNGKPIYSLNEKLNSNINEKKNFNLDFKDAGEYIFKIDYEGEDNTIYFFLILNDCYSVSLPFSKNDYENYYKKFINLQEGLFKDMYKIENLKLNENFIEKQQDSIENYIKIFTIVETVIIILFSSFQIFYLIKLIDNKRLI